MAGYTVGRCVDPGTADGTLGGLIEFYRSPARVQWSPTGTNVPDYPKLAQLWWQNIGEAVSGEVTVDTAMDNLAKEMDRVLERIARRIGLLLILPKIGGHHSYSSRKRRTRIRLTIFSPSVIRKSRRPMAKRLS